jgi:hypothetical protein
MALDYSKLSDEELNAIANDDYSKLSDATLTAITNEPTAVTQPQPDATINPAPQVASMAGRVAGMVPEAVSAGAGAVRSGVQAMANMPAQQAARVAIDTASVMAGHPPYASILRAATDTAAGTPVKEVFGNAVNVAKQGLGAVGGMARGLGGALVRGAIAPESAIMMPYQMAAYEQDKIRANPNAPGLQYNPYAQVQRGEYATQGAAGAANTRRAVMNMPYGAVTPAEKAMLDQDKQQRMRMMMQYEAAKRVLGQQ